MEFRCRYVSHDCIGTIEHTAHKFRVALSVAHVKFIRSEIDNLGSGTKIPSDIECTRVLPRFAMPLDQEEHQRCLASLASIRTLRERGLHNKTEQRFARLDRLGHETVSRNGYHATKAIQTNGKKTPLLESVGPRQHNTDPSLIFHSQSHQS